MLYNKQLQNTTVVSEFDYNSPCVWIVYPPGCAGDLWGSIINYHYPRTGNHFLGIDTTGKVILSTIDHRYLDTRTNNGLPVLIGQTFIDHVNQEYRNQNFPRSLSGMTILVNHLWMDSVVKQIIDQFPFSKIIRILPANDFEFNLTQWLSQWKNSNHLSNFNKLNLKNSVKDHAIYHHERLLDISFGLMWSRTGYEQVYDQVVQHLELDYKIARYDLIKFWFDCQHELIKPHLEKLFDSE